MAKRERGPEGPGRRTFLQWSAGLVGGVAAVACAPGASPAPGAEAASPAAGAARGRRVLVADGRVQAPVPDDVELDPAAVSFGGALADATSGNAAGTFRAQATELFGPGLELHTLQLPEGTLFALGPRSGGRAGSYTVMGGTAAFVGARGTCDVRTLAEGPVRSRIEITLTLS